MNIPSKLSLEKLTLIKNNLELNLARQKLIRLKFSKQNLIKKLNHLENKTAKNVFFLDPDEPIVEIQN